MACKGPRGEDERLFTVVSSSNSLGGAYGAL